MTWLLIWGSSQTLGKWGPLHLLISDTHTGILGCWRECLTREMRREVRETFPAETMRKLAGLLGGLDVQGEWNLMPKWYNVGSLWRTDPVNIDLAVLHAFLQRRNELSVSSKQRKRIQLSKEVASGEWNSCLEWGTDPWIWRGGGILGGEKRAAGQLLLNKHIPLPYRKSSSCHLPLPGGTCGLLGLLLCLDNLSARECHQTWRSW